MKSLLYPFAFALTAFLILYSCSAEEEDTTPPPQVQQPTPEPEVSQYTLTVTAGEGGTVSTEGGTYDEGTEVTITATPDEGYEFVGWEGSDSNSLSITLNGNTTVQALFVRLKNLQNKGPNYSDINSKTQFAIQNKFFSGNYITSQRALAHGLNINPTAVDFADYRYSDPNRTFLDYDRDSLIDMAAFLTNFKNPPYASSPGKFLLVNDVFGPNPDYNYFDTSGRWIGGKMTVFENQTSSNSYIIVTNEEDHILQDGSRGQPGNNRILTISEEGNLIENLFGETVASHQGSFGDIDNDGDIDVIINRFNYTVQPQSQYPNMPLVYLNDGNQNFIMQDSFTVFDGMEGTITLLNDGTKVNYSNTAVELFDVDGDSNLDIIIGHFHNFPEPDYNEFFHENTRIYWGNGSGIYDFLNGYTDIPVDYKNNVDALSGELNILGFGFIDYDNDGDLDVVTTVTPIYNGYAIQLAENIGNRNFRDVTKEKINGYYSTHNGFAPEGKFPNFYEIRVYDKDDDGDYDLVPDKIANWGAGPNQILQNLYWENTGGQFVRRELD
jgi:hypothetical protein